MLVIIEHRSPNSVLSHNWQRAEYSKQSVYLELMQIIFFPKGTSFVQIFPSTTAM